MDPNMIIQTYFNSQSPGDISFDTTSITTDLPSAVDELPGKLTCPLKKHWLEDVFPIEIVPF